jgi:Uma2 family endonuclease
MPVHDLSAEWTAEMAIALPADGKRYEVLDGELFVTPAPSWDHQSALEILFPPVTAYVRAHRLGYARWSPADIVFSRRRLLQPDMFVVPWQEGGPPRSWADVTSLLLAVEVLSPSSARADRHRKRLIYQDQRVPEYWIVDIDARLVERWRPEDLRPEIITGLLEWAPHAGVETLRIDLPAMFKAVHGEV